MIKSINVKLFKNTYFLLVHNMYFDPNFNFVFYNFFEKCQISSFFDFTDFRQSLCTKSSSSWIPGLGGTDCNSCGRLNQLIQESSSVFDLCSSSAGQSVDF